MAIERQESSHSGTERLVKAVHQQAEWLVLKFQNVLEGNKVVYVETNVDGALSKTRAKKVSVVLYVMAVTFLAVSSGFHYTFVWKPCPKNFFYKSQRPCKNGCANKEYAWNKTSWYEGKVSYCGNKMVNCSKDLKPEMGSLNVTKSRPTLSASRAASRDGFQ